MNKIKYLSIAAAVAISLAFTGCNNKGDNTNTAANNTNKTATNSNATTNSTANTNSEAANSKPDSGPIGSLATPTDAYKTAFELRKKKDIQGLKRVLSKDFLDLMTAMGKLGNESLDDMLKEMVDEPQAPTAEVRNEKINGDTATIEYLDAKGGWSKMGFVKVGSDWKLNISKGDMQSDGPPKKP